MCHADQTVRAVGGEAGAPALQPEHDLPTLPTLHPLEAKDLGIVRWKFTYEPGNMG